MKLDKWIKRGIIPALFLCLELIVLCTGGRAFYARPAEVSITDGVPSADLAPLLPPEGWSTQRQWFTARGEYFNRILFYTMAKEGEGGFTINLRDENGALITAEHFSQEECSAGALFFNIQKTVRYGGRYCFEVVADPGGSGWAVPYLFVPGGEPSAWEDALYDEQPMGGGSCYLFLSFFYARMNYAAVALHVFALLAGAAYLFRCFIEKRTHALQDVDMAMLCAACVCAAGQFILCKNYYLGKTLLICLPCASLVAIALFRLVREGQLKIRLRISLRSWKSIAFLAGALLLSAMLMICIRGRGIHSLGACFYISIAAFLAFLVLGIFSTPWLDEFCGRFPWLLYAVQSVLIFFQMEIANANPNPLREMGFFFAFWNILTIFAVFAVLWAFLGNARRAGIIGTILFAIWGISNYFTVSFRGIPITPGDLMSAGTALNVLGNYSIELNMSLTSIFVLIVLEVLLLFRIPAKTDNKMKTRKGLTQREAVILCIVLFFWQGYFGGLAPLDLTTLEWDWKVGYYPQGYTAVSIAKIQKLFIQSPAGYTATEVQMLCEKEQERMAAVQTDPDFRPNIILILNESWFDWRQVTEFETDQPVMPFIDNLENCIKGFAVEPANCGGTSLSEYELLTSNSLSMMPETTPFTQRNLNGSYSVASYLNDLGYTTTALHPGAARNYNRSVVYPQIGFDRIAFAEDGIWEDASCLRTYISDDSAFGVIKMLFDEKEADTPVLIYLLTMQNHGSYEMTVKNGGVHLLTDAYEINVESGFDQCKGAAEEYLSLIRHTDAAFEGLTGYFKSCSEPTLICMVGDHGPAFGTEVESPYEGYEWSQRQRGTPFVIWANYPIESYDAGYTGMVQLVPLLIKTAGLPLSVYYQTILDLGEQYPAINAGFYQDRNGNFGSYSYTKEIPQNEQLKQYFYFEYNSLLSPKNRLEKIFLVN